MAISNYSIQLDGTDTGSIVSTTLADNLSNFSVSVWLKTPTPPVSNSAVIGKFDSGIFRGWVISFSNNPTMVIYTDIVGGNFGGFSWPLDAAWHNMVYTFDAATGVRAYLDGVLKSFSPYVFTGQTFSNVQPLEISTLIPFIVSSKYQGLLDDLRMWNTTLSPSDILIISQGGSPVSSPIADWAMEEGTGVVLVDSIAANNFTFNALTWTNDVPLPLNPPIFLNLSDVVNSNDTFPQSFSIQSDIFANPNVPVVENLVNQLVPASVKTYFTIQE